MGEIKKNASNPVEYRTIIWREPLTPRARRDVILSIGAIFIALTVFAINHPKFGRPVPLIIPASPTVRTRLARPGVYFSPSGSTTQGATHARDR